MESISEAKELIRKFLIESHVTPEDDQVSEIKSLILSGELTFQALVKQIKEQHELHQIEKQKPISVEDPIEIDQKKDVKQEKAKSYPDLKTMFSQKEEKKKSKEKTEKADDEENNEEDDITKGTEPSGDGGLFEEMTAEKLSKISADIIKASVLFLQKQLPTYASEVLKKNIDDYFKPIKFSDIVSEYEKSIEKARDQIEKSLARNAMMPTIACSILKISFINLGVDKKVIGQFFSEFFKVVSQRFYIMYSKIISKNPDIQIK